MTRDMRFGIVLTLDRKGFRGEVQATKKDLEGLAAAGGRAAGEVSAAHGRRPR